MTAESERVLGKESDEVCRKGVAMKGLRLFGQSDLVTVIKKGRCPKKYSQGELCSIVQKVPEK